MHNRTKLQKNVLTLKGISHERFFDFVNDKDHDSYLEDHQRELRATLEELLAFVGEQNPDQRDYLRDHIYDRINFNMANPDLELLPDPERIARPLVFWKVFAMNYWYALALMLEDPNIGPGRFGKCEWCGKYFIAYKKSGGQRFCASQIKGKKSKCAVDYHISERKKRKVETIAGLPAAQYYREYRQLPAVKARAKKKRSGSPSP